MSKNSLILGAAVILVLGVVIGRYALTTRVSQSTSASSQDESAQSASRAMTFTQPNAPTKAPAK